LTIGYDRERIFLGSFDRLLPHCTVRLIGIVNNQVVSTGTGFYYFFNDTFTDKEGRLNESGTARLGIVTNRHVIEGMEEVIFYFNSSEDGQPGYQKDSLRLRLDERTVIFHPEADVDLCVILAHDIKEILEKKNRKLHIYPIRNSIRVNESQIEGMGTIQNLLMIGYPNGIWDSINNLPIIRRGINATPLYENYQGEEAFAVDIATYRGSSGSPVFIYNSGVFVDNGQIKYGDRLNFIGIIKAAHLSTKEHTEDVKTEEMLHIGIAIKAKKIDVFEELVRKHYED
jgi:hypothetical protein